MVAAVATLLVVHTLSRDRRRLNALAKQLPDHRVRFGDGRVEVQASLPDFPFWLATGHGLQLEGRREALALGDTGRLVVGHPDVLRFVLSPTLQAAIAPLPALSLRDGVLEVRGPSFSSDAERERFGARVASLVQELRAWSPPAPEGVRLFVEPEGARLRTHLEVPGPLGDLELRHRDRIDGDVPLANLVLGMTLGLRSRDPGAAARLEDPELAEPLMALLHGHPDSSLRSEGLYVVCEGYPEDRLEVLAAQARFVTSRLRVTEL